MDCKRCERLMPRDSLTIARVDTSFEYIVCHTTCDSEEQENSWMSLEDYLTDRGKSDGWHTADNEDDLLKHYILNRIIYYSQETPDISRDECEFDVPDPQDVVRLLWFKSKPIAFYTIKRKGQHIERGNQYYALTTLDTAFVRKSSRGKGNGLSIIRDFVESHPNEDVGFSSPISQPMLKVLNSFVTRHPEYRHRLWQISGSGAEGQRKLIWFSLAKMRRALKHTG
ncbi:family with sequence similarity 169, member A [Nesidiocoris tenuis]|uniref:Family with sequence similarity 169, member A n=1 Tax=Nesidiocoris tenuis TaxID=355587 RepID=A0ABN7A5J4_9HEMI|nr:family with sequence similarity 169, member A [Nesidiocoris tenuis]